MYTCSTYTLTKSILLEVLSSPNLRASTFPTRLVLKDSVFNHPSQVQSSTDPSGPPVATSIVLLLTAMAVMAGPRLWLQTGFP